MIRKAIAATMLLLAALLLPAASATAVAVPGEVIRPTSLKAVPYPGNVIRHHNPDAGYNAPFTLYCHDGKVISLPEGGWSKLKCASVWAVSLGTGQQMLCYEGNGQARYFYPGVTVVHEGAWSKEYDCTMQVN